MRWTPSRCLALLLLVMSGTAAASWTVSYDGPDELFLIGWPNSAGTNTRGAELHPRPLPSGRLSEVLAPIVTTALDGCSMNDVRRIVITPTPSHDRIGDTMTRIHGLGIYLNLPLADRVSMGNFYLAPFLIVTVSLQGDNGPLQSVDLYEFSKAILDKPNITQEGFLDARTGDVEASVTAFVKRQLPAALRKALSPRCPAA